MFDYIGEIQYGDFKNSNWYGNFTDKNDPRITKHIAKIMSKPEMFEGLDLHIVGGLLEGWGTWDIDWALSGSFNKAQVKKAIDWITKIGLSKTEVSSGNCILCKYNLSNIYWLSFELDI